MAQKSTLTDGTKIAGRAIAVIAAFGALAGVVLNRAENAVKDALAPEPPPIKTSAVLTPSNGAFKIVEQYRDPDLPPPIREQGPNADVRPYSQRHAAPKAP